MYVLDCGKNSSTLYNPELDTNPKNQPPSPESLANISHAQVLRLHEVLPKGSQLRCEYAHLGCPRRRRSKAQPFTEDQLLQFYADLREADIDLKLTPQHSTPRAQNRYRLAKSDTNDPKSICLLLQEYPEISLMKPPTSFEASKKRKESYEWVDESNLILNNQRSDDYSEDNCLYIFLRDHAQEIFDNLPPLVADAFSKKDNARFKKNDKRRGPHQQKGHINIKNLKYSQIYAVLCQLLDDENNLRLREDGQLAGWKFIKRYSLKMSPFHLKGGVARSNLYYHGLRNWVARKAAEELGTITNVAFKKKRRGGYTDSDTGKYIEPMTHEEEQTYLKYRRQYCKAVKLLYIECKRILEREYNLLETNNGVHSLISTLV